MLTLTPCLFLALSKVGDRQSETTIQMMAANATAKPNAPVSKMVAR
jgi:hypothetical protein